MGYRKNAIKGVSWMGFFRLSTRVLSFARIAIIARILMPSQFGIYGVAALVLALLETFTETGINIFLIQEKTDLKEYISTAWIASIIRGTFISVIILFATPFIASYFNVSEYWYVIALIAGVSFIRGFINPARVAFQKDLSFGKEFFFAWSVFLFDLIVTIFAVIVTRSPVGIVYGLIAGALLELTLSFVLIKPRPTFNIEISKLKQIFGRGKWITAGGIFNYLFSNLDDIVVGRILGVAMLGLYQAAYKISSLPITEVSNVVRSVTFPIFVKFSDDKARLKRAHLISMFFIFLISASLGVTIFIFPELIVEILLGKNWLQAVPVLKILAIFGVLRALTVSANSLFNSVKLQKYIAIYTSASLFALAVTIFYFVSNFGLIGAGYSTVVGAVAGFFISIYLTVKILK